ncbi:MAG: flagellar basal body rod protein FlgB [Planctomycetota bacterium]|nr:flagellar basal body rod protein FlgB [Planctomycetota bacterium]
MSVDIRTTLEAATRASQIRQSVIANNIANLDTPGYRRRVVAFEDLFAKAMAQGKVDPNELQAQLLAPMDSPVDEKGNDVSMDQEMGDLVKTAAATKTYMKLLAKVYKQMEAAIG